MDAFAGSAATAIRQPPVPRSPLRVSNALPSHRRHSTPPLLLGLALAACFDENALAGAGDLCVIDDESAAADQADHDFGVPIAQRGSGLLPRWTSGHGLALAGDALWVADTDNDAVVTMAAATLQARGRVVIGGGPAQLIVGPDGVAFAGQRYGDRVVRLSADAAGAPIVTGDALVGDGALAVALSPAADALFVATTTTPRLLRLNPVGLQVEASAALGTAPTGLVCAGAGVVALHRDGALWTFVLPALLAGNVPVRRPLAKAPTSRACATDTDNDRAIAHASAIVALDPGEGYAVAHASVDLGQPGAAAPAATAAEANGSPPVAPPTAAERRCSALGAVTADQADRGVSSLPTTVGYGGTVILDRTGCRDPVRSVDPVVSLVAAAPVVGKGGPPDANEPVLPPPPPLRRLHGRALAALGSSPADIAAHPQLKLSFLAGAASNSVLVYAGRYHGRSGDAAPYGPALQAPVGVVAVGAHPRALAIDDAGDTLYVLEGHGFHVAAVPLAGLRVAAIYAPWQGQVSHRGRFGDDPLSPQLRLGRRTFHDATNPRLVQAGAFACATCHPDGADDRLVWNVPAGPRQTPALAGRLLDTAPFTWDGSRSHLASAMQDSIQRVGGTGLTDAELAALVAYVRGGLRRPANTRRDGKASAAAERGKALFFRADVGCASCHAGGSGTDGKRHDVGTTSAAELVAFGEGQRFDTPSLRDVFASAPYLHDGSAATLSQMLQRTSTTMGRTDHLSGGERDDLIAYLETL